jgi:DNA-binding NarL/FixJ family response regulator
VGEAEDGAEAISLVQLLRPDIVLMDFVMPRVNGLEALRRIKAERPETKVIIMTVHTEDAYRRTAEANGTDAFLLKKTLMTALLPTIRRIRSSMSPPNSC